jgi:hypothetical protein
VAPLNAKTVIGGAGPGRRCDDRVRDEADMSGTVFVLGAGASYGDTLEFFSGYTGDAADVPPSPPLTEGFFNAEHIRGDLYEIEQQYSGLVAHIREHWGFRGPFGRGQWASLSIEDVFTSLALQNDFLPSESDDRALSQVLLNSLAQYIRQRIAYCTLFRFGVYTKALAEQLKPEDSILTFNYDLLMDRELLDSSGSLHYQNFGVKFLGRDLVNVDKDYNQTRARLTMPAGVGPVAGLYLKLHGSLNWFKCANTACPNSKIVVLISSVPQALGSSALGIPFQCNYCHSQLSAYLVPPLAQKRVVTDPFLRNVWGNAFALLEAATRVIVIGVSFQPSDFYAAWLFRYALNHRADVKILVVNPLNEPTHPLHGAFRERMKSIFAHGYDDTFQRFDQIAEIIEAG